jgi:hypothetical protein
MDSILKHQVGHPTLPYKKMEAVADWILREKNYP